MLQMSDDRHKDLWRKIKTVTERRLAFDRQMRERAAAAKKGASQTSRISTPAQSSSGTYTPTVIDQDGGVLSIEGRVTYLKLQGDQLVHLAEMASVEQTNGDSVRSDGAHEQDKDLASQALNAYLSARHAASGIFDEHEFGDVNGGSKRRHAASRHNEINNCSGDRRSCPSLPELHPLRLELAWRISSVLFHLLDRPVEAWEAAYPTYTAGAEHPARLGQRGLSIMELLRDQLALIDVRTADGSGYREGKEPPRAAGDHDDIKEGWEFLRASETANSCAGMADAGARGVARFRDIVAQVRHSRACMDGVVKVLLGTMVEADTIFRALETIFAACVERYAISSTKCPPTDDGDNVTDNSVWCQSRLSNFQRFLACRPLLSWSGFEVVCHHFKLAKRGSASTINPRGKDPAQQAQCRSPSTSEHRLQAGESEPAARATEGFLLTGVQTLIAFFCACTHGSVVASFPDGNGEAAATAVAAAAGDAVGCNDDMKGHQRRDEEEAYWKDVEDRLADAAGPTSIVPQGAGLSFPQFVDALARCGLLGNSPPNVNACEGTSRARAEWRAVENLRNQPHSPGKRIQSIFTKHMGLLDSENVRKRVRELKATVKGTASAR